MLTTSGNGQNFSVDLFASLSDQCPQTDLIPQQREPEKNETPYISMLPTPTASMKGRHDQGTHDEGVLDGAARSSVPKNDRRQLNSSTKWEGIDPDLLAEFQDLVNFI